MSSPADEPALREAVVQRARQFSPEVLYRLAERLWPDRPIRLRSKRSSAPEPTAVDSIEVGEEQVILTLNIGLLSSTSPLPSYFREMEVDPLIGPALAGLLNRIDDSLLRSRIGASCAGSDSTLCARTLEKDLPELARLPSPSGLWWLFSRVFPELSVTVERGHIGATLAAADARVGFAMLGSATLGGRFSAPAPGFDVVLRITRVDTWTEADWPSEAAARLPRLVWPALSGAEVSLRVWLVDPRGRSVLRLGDGKVGVEPLATPASPEVFLVFEGTVVETKSSSLPGR